MTKEEFKIQLVRLEKQFGTYGIERSLLLWQKIEGLTEKWFKSAMDSKIAYSRFIPLPSDFDADIEQERERMRRREKEQHASDAKKFWEDGWGTYPNDEKATICTMIKKRAMGKVSDEEWEPFYSSLKNAAAKSPEGSSVTIVKTREE